MDEMWFEEELSPDQETIEQMVSKAKLQEIMTADKEQVWRAASCRLRVHRPRWGELDPKSHRLLSAGGVARFFLVRLGFEFDIPKEVREKDGRIIYARCAAYLWSADSSLLQPAVNKMIPSDLYEGELRQVSVELGPEIKIGEVSGTLGKVSTDLTVGTVEPEIVSWYGEDERAPYWELRPKSKALLGVRHFWLVAEVPVGLRAFRLATQVQCDVQTHVFGVIPIGPRTQDWAKRPSILIERTEAEQ